MSKLVKKYPTLWSPFSWLNEHSSVFDFGETNIYKEDGNLHIELPLTGFDVEDINVEASEDFVTVSAKKEVEEKPEREYYTKSRRSYSKTLSLPESINAMAAKAEHNGNRLHVFAPIIEADDAPGKRVIKVSKEE